jgi:uncharacterized protein
MTDIRKQALLAAANKAAFKPRSDIEGRHYPKLHRATLTASLMLVAIAGAAVAGPLEDGEAAYQREDYATAYRLLGPLADQGNAEAQDMLGTMYVVGEGVPKNYSEAVKWYRRAADQGNADAQSHLGLMYHNGLGVPQDYVEAMKWCRLAADQGNAEAQDMLGTMYDHSGGVAKNYSEAVKWYRRAADQGNADAQSHLGLMYAAGEGVPRDYVRAHKWLNLSAARGNNFAIKYKDNIAQRMTPVQIAEAQKLAREWKPKPER